MAAVGILRGSSLLVLATSKASDILVFSKQICFYVIHVFSTKNVAIVVCPCKLEYEMLDTSHVYICIQYMSCIEYKLSKVNKAYYVPIPFFYVRCQC